MIKDLAQAIGGAVMLMAFGVLLRIVTLKIYDVVRSQWWRQ